MFPER